MITCLATNRYLFIICVAESADSDGSVELKTLVLVAL